MTARRTMRAVSAALAGALLAAPALAQDSVTVVSWGGAYQDAQREVFFRPFEEETGIRVNEETWEGGIGAIRARLASGGDPGWDVVQVEAADILLGCEEGLFEPIDWDRLGGEDSVIPGAAQECGVGAILFNEGIAYDRDALPEGPTGWADFFDTERFPGKRALRMHPAVALMGALMADGVPKEEVTAVLATPEGEERAFAKLETIRDDLIFWRAGAQPPQLLASGEVVMTTVYNGRIDAANREEGRNFAFVWDGSVGSFDYWVILAGTPRIEQAYAFLEYIHRPEVQARLPDAIAYGVVHREAADDIDPERLPDVPSAPENLAVSVTQDLEFWLENAERLTERLQSWAGQ
ncbi:ABC transporter substrate-binding protein [Rubellimicrobium sp. CFH 75288]|uniref:ABC transporter substrate-binding protein n=1 Tax=Rubellimicrobium sp. CFH 75288 TaxID=2697034 RepID=UPI001411F1D5|nr:ABC transporter substrate-binding protein [Rubellimicrobium sp. CFH 75288]NAZ37813.1 extracellular solute-binding protein [Rubellimicrobium sp. CFH 75288]